MSRHIPWHTLAHRLVVWAADGTGKDARSASASIIVHVQDMNDNAPTFKRLLHDNPNPDVPFEFRENEVGLVRRSDPPVSIHSCTVLYMHCSAHLYICTQY